MDEPPRISVEERKVRAARRFGWFGLVVTTGYMLLVPVSTLWNGVPRPGIALFSLFVVGLGLHLWRVRQATRSLGQPAPLWFMVVAAAVALSMTLLALDSSPFGFFWSLAGGVLLGDIVGGMRARWIAVWVTSSAVVVFVLGSLVLMNQLDGRGIPSAPFVLAGLTAFFVATMWAIDVERLWWLKAVIDMDESRRAAAELATARERLRLADDLHDILGHALEVVAFKSELATRLQTVDPDRARSEMEEVQRVARESLTEVRALVRDTRATDLVTELAGARAVLGSAGVVLRVEGDPATVGPTARNVLGRVLREAMTNVLRHAEPSHCTIGIDVVDGAARLRVINDGALPSDETDPGTGLAALSRYLDDHAGHLDAGLAADGTFRLDATLPVGAR